MNILAHPSSLWPRDTDVLRLCNGFSAANYFSNEAMKPMSVWCRKKKKARTHLPYEMCDLQEKNKAQRFYS